MRPRAFRIHQTKTHMNRRLKEDRNQHYDNLRCACWTEPKAIARFKEQPKVCTCRVCGNPRKWQKGSEGLTMQERRAPAE